MEAGIVARKTDGGFEAQHGNSNRLRQKSKKPILMADDEKNNSIRMIRLGLSTPEERNEYEENKIDFNKKISHLNSSAAKNAKQTHCLICQEPCTSFCNSHSVPQFALHRIADAGKVMSPLQGEIPTLGNDLGVKKAGTFHIICNKCDNAIFQQYENPGAYVVPPTDQMLAQIALKNLLLMISKRNEERELYKLLGEQFPNRKNLTEEKIYIGDYDLRDYHESLKYAKVSLTEKKGKRYHLCYYKKLDYVVPYTAQSSITMICGFENDVINNIYYFDATYRTKDIHVAIFPLEESSVVLLFIEDGEKRYRKFYRQLSKLSEEDQLAAINYIVFSYTENVFLHPKTHQLLKNNDCFMDICRKSTDYSASFPFFTEDPLEKAIKEFSLSQRNKIPNLLNREFALK